MFSLIKKGIHALRPESCSLCPYGDGTHPPAKIRWDIRDKDAKPLSSKKRIASGSLLMLPDQAETDPIGGPRGEVLPALFCEFHDCDELPRLACEPPSVTTPPFAGPKSAEVRFETGAFEISSRIAWTPRNLDQLPRTLEGWLRTSSGPVLPATGRVLRRDEWRPSALGPLPSPIHPIDQEIEVQLRAQPSAFPLQAALPVSTAEKLSWNRSDAVMRAWDARGPGLAPPEVRKHRPLYAAPLTPIPRIPPPESAASGVSPYRSEFALGGLTLREERFIRNWTAAARTPAPRGLTPIAMPLAPLMRQRFRGWQGTPKESVWRACDHRSAAAVPVSGWALAETGALVMPSPVFLVPRRAAIEGYPRPNWIGLADAPFSGTVAHSASFGRAVVAVPEIPD